MANSINSSNNFDPIRIHKKAPVGSRFGRLTVTGYKHVFEKGKGRWKVECQCGCGTRGVVVRPGKTQSCGCLQKETSGRNKGSVSSAQVERNYPVGSRYGKLVVTGHEHYEDVNGRGRWRVACDCDCGSSTVINQPHWLKIGDTTSCGCVHRAMVSTLGKRTGPLHKLPGYEALIRKRMHSYRNCANRKNLQFAITKEKFSDLIHGKCVYCGFVPNPPETWNGVDRVNSGCGYVDTNVVSSCKTCNFAKQRMSVEEFLLWVNRVATYTHENTITVYPSMNLDPTPVLTTS